MNIHIIIISGGVGKRYGKIVPKQYTRFSPKEFIIERSIKKLHYFEKYVKTITTVCHKNWVQFTKEKINFHFTNAQVHVIEGGKERHDSIWNGLSFLEGYLNGFNNNDFIILQEAVRPFCSKKIIEDLIAAPKNWICVAPVLSPQVLFANFDAEKNKLKNLISKNDLVELQLPRRYKAKPFFEDWKKYIDKYSKNPSLDEAEVVIAQGGEIKHIPGNPENIKITVPFHEHFIRGTVWQESQTALMKRIEDLQKEDK